jgi:hypothetical protein
VIQKKEKCMINMDQKEHNQEVIQVICLTCFLVVEEVEEEELVVENKLPKLNPLKKHFKLHYKIFTMERS